MGIVQPQTAEALRRTAALYERVKTVIPPMEWAAFADDIDAILRLKKQRNAIILAHNYQTPEIFHGVADIRGDSLALAREAATAKADVIVMAGVHFMAETAKLLNPASTVLIPDAKAGCSLAESITAADVRLMRERYPGVPVVTYVNTSAAVKAESDICCTSGNAKKVIESLGVPQVIMLPDEYLAQNVAKETKVKIIAWKGHCEVHERFTAADIKKFRVQNPGVVVLAHPECPPEVVAASDFAGSTARMIEWVETKKPSRVVLLTECSMSDNVAASNPDVQFIRPCQLCPHMKRITLKNIRHALETMTTEVIVPADIAGCARLAVERMISGGMMKTVIVGAGLAGLTAALALAPKPVVVLSPKKLGEECSSSWAQGGIAAAIDTNDSAASHAADTVKAGVGLCDAATVDAVTESGAGIIEKLVSRGVGFDRDAQNKLQLALEAAHSTRRVAHVADGTGLAIMQAMITAARATPSIEILENAFATQLLTEHGSITGVAVTHNGKPMMLEADSVVLATGGAGALWRHTTNPLGSYGGGLALAVRAGAQLADLEFMQFHPTAIDIGLDPMPLASEALRGEGCTLIGETGERFTDEMQPRDVVARAIDKHLSQKHRVFLDARTALGNNFVERFPGINGFCLAAGIDPAHAPIPVRPAAHYHMGGVATDLYGRTNIEGLWACGEVASTGLHGANRLASNSLLEAAAFGERVAEDISGRNNKLRHAREGGHPIWSEKTWDTRLRGYDESALVREIMSSHVGISRDESGLKNAINQLQPHIQTSDMALAAYMIAGFALLRQESRGAHTRSDFPATSKDWQYRQIFTLTELQAHLQQTEQPILQAVGV